jgi:hypothetical protein
MASDSRKSSMCWCYNDATRVAFSVRAPAHNNRPVLDQVMDFTPRRVLELENLTPT